GGAAASGVAQTQIRLSYLMGATTFYWDASGSAFSNSIGANAAWTTASLGWLYAPSINWPTDQSHFILLEARSTDNATAWNGAANGNVGPVTSVSFYVDIATPTATIGAGGERET